MKDWTYRINYGPEGEDDFANVYDQGLNLIGNFRTYHAIRIVKHANAYSQLIATLKEADEYLDSCHKINEIGTGSKMHSKFKETLKEAQY